MPRIHIEVTNDLLDTLRASAAAAQRSVSGHVRALVIEASDKSKPPSPKPSKPRKPSLEEAQALNDAGATARYRDKLASGWEPDQIRSIFKDMPDENRKRHEAILLALVAEQGD